MGGSPMMEHAVFALPMFLLFVVVLFLWSLIGARGKWWLKLLFISTIPLSTVIVWSSLHSYLGWPTPDELPEKFLVYWAVIEEPNQKTGDPGSIYLWVRSKKYSVVPLGALFGYRHDPKALRSYYLPYSRELHEQLAGMQSELKAGRPVAGENHGFGKGKGTKSKGQGEGAEGRRQGERGRGDRGRGNPYGTMEGDIQFYKLPPVQLPSKDPPPPG